MTSAVDAIDVEIADYEKDIREGRVARAFVALGLVGLLAVESLLVWGVVAFALSTASTGRTDSDAAVIIPVALFGTFGVVAGFANLGDKFLSIGAALQSARLSLERLREDRKRTLAGGATSRLAILNRYKNDLPEIVEVMRLTARRYRSRHNFLQSVVMLGSLGSAAVIALFGESEIGRVIAIASTTIVTVAAAYSSYFRFKDKSIGMQSTADSIEQEHRSVQLGIGVYQGKSPLEMLTLFAERVESYRVNQRRQALELDQQVQIEYQGGPTHDIQ